MGFVLEKTMIFKYRLSIISCSNSAVPVAPVAPITIAIKAYNLLIVNQ
tara:strand:- start:1754 stop:1897 length:144 start_codon:yes stop_codon:yes gene_type:complete